MSKAVTVEDLNKALKPIFEVISRLRENETVTSTQVFQIHEMVTGLSVKLDQVDQVTGSTLNEVSKSAKKTTGRKPAAPRKPAAKKVVTKATDDDDEDDVADDVADDADAGDAAAGDDDDADDAAGDDYDVVTTKKPAPKKVVPAKKAAVKKVDTPKDTPKDTPEDAPKEVPAVEKKLPVKKTAPKTTAKKAPPVRYNKLTIFKDSYKQDPSKFNKYLTDKVKASMASDNKEKWAGLSDADLLVEQAKAYCIYMNAHHTEVLDQLKVDYVKDLNSSEVEESE